LVYFDWFGSLKKVIKRSSWTTSPSASSLRSVRKSLSQRRFWKTESSRPCASASPGSPLRAVGLMTAMTAWVTFADDDVRWDDGHVAALAEALLG